jgi:hypothetical protein
MQYFIYVLNVIFHIPLIGRQINATSYKMYCMKYVHFLYIQYSIKYIKYCIEFVNYIRYMQYCIYKVRTYTIAKSTYMYMKYCIKYVADGKLQKVSGRCLILCSDHYVFSLRTSKKVRQT